MPSELFRELLSSSDLLEDYSKLQNALSAFQTLSTVALVAALIGTVFVYVRYVRMGYGPRLFEHGRVQWEAFLRFDILIIERVLKLFYLFALLRGTLFYVAVVISAMFIGAEAFFKCLFYGLLALILIELLIRLVYEFLMLAVIRTRNTSAILHQLSGRMPPKPVPNPVPSPRPATCWKCHNVVNPTERFCGVCGADQLLRK